MSFRKLGMALLVVVALGAIAANSASAAENWSEGTSAWYTGASPGTKLKEKSGETPAETKVLKTKIDPETKLSLLSSVGGEELTIDATGVNCLSCTIENVTGPHAIAHGELEFTGVTLAKPDATVCSVATTITTKPLTATVGMKKGSTTIDTVRFAPTAGSTAAFATVTFLGASCPIAGSDKVTGVAYGEALNPTGTFAKLQTVKFSEAIQKDAQLVANELKFGTNPAYLIGTVSNFLSPEIEFAVKEK